MSFQKQVNMYPAIAVEGDFASVNPRASVLAIDAALVAGGNGVVVGRFAWADDARVVNNTGTGAPTGFVSRRGNQAAITQWLGRGSMLVPAGMNVTLHNGGDFFAKTSTASTIGQKVFASTTDGTVSTGAAGATIAGSIETEFYAVSAVSAGELLTISTRA